MSKYWALTFYFISCFSLTAFGEDIPTEQPLENDIPVEQKAPIKKVPVQQLAASKQQVPEQLFPSLAIKKIKTSVEKDSSPQADEIKYAEQRKVLNQTLTSQDCDPVTVRPIHFSFTQEQINLSTNRTNATYNERIGLTGVTANIEDPSGFFLGAGSYFASTGKRGGFIGIGVNTGYSLLINNTLRLTPSLFIGGSGGAGVDSTGGGWIVRPSFAATVDLKYVWLGGGISYLTAPQGYLRSTQPFAQISIPYDFMFTDFLFYPENYPQKTPAEQVTGTTYRKFRISPVAKSYNTPALLKTTTNISLADNIKLAGVNIEHFMNKNWFFNLELLGAFTKEIKGYMTLMGGPGFSYELLEDLYVEPQIKVGMLGGGNANVAGGIGTEPSVDLVWEAGRRTNLNFGIGYLYSFGGDFRFFTSHLGLGVHFDAHETQERYDDTFRGYALSSHQQSNWKVALSNSHYFIERDTDENIELIGMGLRYFLTPWFSLDGMAFWPYLGNASGYAAGTIGPSFETKILGSPLGVIASFAAGPAARAKKMPVGNGLVYTGNGGLSYNINKELSIFSTFGFVKYAGAGYANTVTGGLNYSFGLPSYKYN